MPEADLLDCVDCGVIDQCGPAPETCPSSQRECGHHCAHAWTHERCCWCEKEWGEGE